MRSTKEKVYKKFIFSILVTILFYQLYGQNIVKVINITPGENAINTSLPFDRPIILKWISKEQVIVKYASLIVIDKGETSEYYRAYAQTNDFYSLQNTSFGNELVKIRDVKLLTNTTLNNDSKYELNIFLPPLRPNKFYDVKLLRRPVGVELDMYVDLFQSVSDEELFKKKLRDINAIKRPFEHRFITGPETGQLRVEDLKKFYETYLKSNYTELAAAGADKDRIAAAITKIKGVIINDEPPSGYKQSLAYIEIFRAIKAKDDDALKQKIHNLAEMQKGYLPVTLDDEHVGDRSITDLKTFYSKNSKIDNFLTQYETANAGEQEIIMNRLASFIVSSELLFADDMFQFGQTLSSSTAVLDFDTRTGYTITPDFGYVYYGFQKGFGTMTPYVGFQLEFRYFDKNIPFNLIHPKSPLHYLSFTTGLTLTSIKKEGKRDDFFGNKSLLTGIGGLHIKWVFGFYMWLLPNLVVPCYQLNLNQWKIIKFYLVGDYL
jgi:hypothetical protein